MINELSMGNKTPNFDFNTPWNNSLNFYKEIDSKDAILIFLRYLGCPVCQMEMASIKRDIDIINGKNVSIFVVLQSSPDMVASACNKEDWPFTIICDPEAEIFQLYCVEAGGIFKYLHPEGLIAAIKAIIKGHKHGKFEGRETQLPASFVISKDKLIKYSYYGKRINDVPSLETLAAKI
jgi:peroxiredoxin